MGSQRAGHDLVTKQQVVNKIKIKHLEHCESEVTQSNPTLCDPLDCSLPGSSVHGIYQARVLEWGAIAFSWGWTNGM